MEERGGGGKCRVYRFRRGHKNVKYMKILVRVYRFWGVHREVTYVKATVEGEVEYTNFGETIEKWYT